MNREPSSAAKFSLLVEEGILTERQLKDAITGAAYRGIPVEKILRHEYHIPRRKLLEALSQYYQSPSVEYDERIPVPFELLLPFSSDIHCTADQWFPVIRDADKVIIATPNPNDPRLQTKVESCFADNRCVYHVALPEDVQSLAEDFLHSHPRHLIGNERTNLAMWRNIMARWRTKLACYRTDFAKVRTHLSLLRGGLTLIAIARTLMHIHRTSPFYFSFWIMIVVAFCLIITGLYHYVRIRKNVLRPPEHQTLVEVTAAVLYCLEECQFVEKEPRRMSTRKTMLARLAESIQNHDVLIAHSHDNKERSYLAHLRTLRAAQRTIAGCYRTVYARARTGLSFIRTGIAFMGIGIGLIRYFGLSMLTGFDLILVGASLWMLIDGALWYLPASKEQSEIPDFILRSSWGQ